MTTFLTPDELHHLTGYVRAADQIRWLRAHGWMFEVSGARRPVVLSSYAQDRMSAAGTKPANPAAPNFAALKTRA